MKFELNRNFIRSYLNKRGISMNQLAHRANVNSSTVTRIMNGKFNPTFATMSKLINALDLNSNDVSHIFYLDKSLQNCRKTDDNVKTKS